MIIEFSMGNYRSFNEIQTVNFRATGLVSEDKSVDANNIADIGDQKMLKTIGVYGPNASGKSNLLKGIHFFKRMVKWSLSNEYLLSDTLNPNKQLMKGKPDNWGYYQIILLLDGKKYRYGFTLGDGEIASEWLFGPAKSNETFYFTRKGSEIKINHENFPEGAELPYKTQLRSDTLFLSFCSAFNGEVSGIIKSFIANNIKHSGSANNYLTTNKLIKDRKKEIVLNWFNEAGLFFNDIEVKEGVVSHSPLTVIEQISLSKNIYDTSGNIIDSVFMDLEQDESEGTKKFYSFIGQLNDKFENGGLLVSDEIDSNFHPSLLQKIIGLFNNPAINKANAQLLFTSHDTNLMSPGIMRRDQFYFTEKSATDATVLYSLSDLKGIRNNADFAKQYLAGYYGALPVLGNFSGDKTIENTVR